MIGGSPVDIVLSVSTKTNQFPEVSLYCRYSCENLPERNV